MKRVFACKQCNNPFILEADVFEPGVSGDIYTIDGKHIHYVDPTEEYLCPECLCRWYEDYLKELAETERGD